MLQKCKLNTAAVNEVLRILELRRKKQKYREK
jgi:hypothetical protein